MRRCVITMMMRATVKKQVFNFGNMGKGVIFRAVNSTLNVGVLYDTENKTGLDVDLFEDYFSKLEYEDKVKVYYNLVAMMNEYMSQ